MRFLVDENLSPRVSELLREGGLDATHVLDHGLGGASDSAVSECALSERRAIISADSDFATLLALSQGVAPSLVLLRSSDQLTPRAQAALLLTNLPALEADLRDGAVVSLGTAHVRVRRLPLAKAVNHIRGTKRDSAPE